MTNHIQIKMLALNNIKIPAAELRHHAPGKIKKLIKSVKRFGILVPLLIDGTGSIIDGVARYQAAKALGVGHLPVIDCSFLTQDEVRALRFSLNRLQEEVVWNKEAVATELRHLVEVGFDLDLTGFEAVEIENFFEIGEAEAEVEDVNVSTLTLAAVSQIGNVWLLKGRHGEHRVACGDIRSSELRKELFEGVLAAACFMDPPYNLAINGHVSGTGKHKEFAVASGELSDEEFKSFLQNTLTTTYDHLAANAVSFVCMDWRHCLHLAAAGDASALELVNICVWTKSNPGMGSFYRSQHELVFVFKRKGQPHRNNVELGRHGRSRSNVWPYRGVNVFSGERELLNSHPTPKPSALVADAIRDVTLPGEIVFDAFLGSGTTLIAAERTLRRCYATEIEPIYVDLAIRRWQLETGLTAVRLSDGTSFTELDNAANEAEVVDGSVQP